MDTPDFLVAIFNATLLLLQSVSRSSLKSFVSDTGVQL